METTDIARRLGEVKSILPQGVRLVAVSKFHPSECIKAAYDAGKICTVIYSSRYYFINWFNRDYIEFVSSNENNTLYHMSVTNANKWSTYTGKLQSKLTFDSEPTAGSTNPVTSDGIKTAIDNVQTNIDTVDAKGIVINEIDGENVICFE